MVVKDTETQIESYEYDKRELRKEIKFCIYLQLPLTKVSSAVMFDINKQAHNFMEKYKENIKI